MRRNRNGRMRFTFIDSEMAALRHQAHAAAPGFSREALASRMLGVLQQVAGR